MLSTASPIIGGQQRQVSFSCQLLWSGTLHGSLLPAQSKTGEPIFRLEPVMNAENSVSGRENRKCRGPWVFMSVGVCGQQGEKSGEVSAKPSQKGCMRSLDLMTKKKKEVESFQLKSDVILYQFKVMALAAAGNPGTSLLKAHGGCLCPCDLP